MTHLLRWSLVGVVIAGGVLSAQVGPPNPTPTPPPPGQDIYAKDGDRIILDENARVKIVRRRQAVIRTVFNPEQRLLVLLIDYPPGDAPDNPVDIAHTYFDVQGDWPLGDRWEGAAVIEEYSNAALPGPDGLGVVTPQGLVQLRNSFNRYFEPRDPTAIGVISFQGSSDSGGAWSSFDQAEQQAIAQAAQMQSNMRGPIAGGVNMNWGYSTGPGGGAAGGIVGGVVGRGGVQAGSVNVEQPVKIHDMPPVYPEAARQAGIQGIVILEVTIGDDGSVTDARVVRSIPELDAAALDAVRQWRYQPLVVAGRAVRFTITVAVRFPPDQVP